MSYNGYNYSHYFNQPTSQSTGRQESQPNQQRTSAVSNLSVSPYHQQQTGVQSSTTNQPRQLNDRQQPSPQVPPDQWYLGGNVTSRGYQGSMAATSGSGPQTQYMNGVGRNGRSHIDTSALGSLAYASGLESSGADGQLSQTNRRSASDYGMNQRRMQTPPARLVSPMRDNSTTPFNNSHNHVRSDSVSSSHSQSKPRSSNPQQQSASGYDNSSLANANYEPYRQRQVGPISDPDVPSHYKGYSSKLTSNSGADLSQYEAYNSRFSTQQAQSSVPQHRIHSPRESQHANPSVQLENPRWQTVSTYRTQSPRAQETNAHPSQPSPINTSQRTQPPVDKFALLDPALPKTETISTATSQTSGQSDRSGHLPRQLHQTPSFRNNNSQGLQDSTAQMEQPRQRHPSQGQEQNNAQSHSLHNIVHHDQQHQSPPALPAAPITVDPSRVFNPYHHEYQLRKAIAEAEEARTVAQAKSPLHNNVADPVSALAPPAERQALPQASLEVRTAILGDQQKIGGPAISRTDARNGNVAVRSERDANIVTTGSGSGDKEQMEAEMRLMLEKMREYKSKDPSLFLQIWEQVKKVCSSTIALDFSFQLLLMNRHSLSSTPC